MKRAIFAIAICVVVVFQLTGCSSKTRVSRVSAEEQIDLSGYWNSTDSRLVSDTMITDALTKPWLMNFVKNQGKNPAVIVGAIKNLTDEHIATGTFVGDIERAFVNSGNVRVVATKSEREGVREEREDQQANASEATVKKFGEELGADYMLIGSINKITDQANKEKTFFYQIDLTLTDMQSNEKVWLGQQKIQKYIARKGYKP